MSDRQTHLGPCDEYKDCPAQSQEEAPSNHNFLFYSPHTTHTDFIFDTHTPLRLNSIPTNFAAPLHTLIPTDTDFSFIFSQDLDNVPTLGSPVYCDLEMAEPFYIPVHSVLQTLKQAFKCQYKDLK